MRSTAVIYSLPPKHEFRISIKNINDNGGQNGGCGLFRMFIIEEKV